MKELQGKFKSNTMMTNSIYSLASKAATMLFFFAFDIACARILDADAYGEWTYFYAIITIVYSVVWFGVNVSGKILIAKTEAPKQRSVLASALVLRFLVSVSLTSVYITIVIIADRMDMLNTQMYEHLKELLLLGSGIVFLNSFAEFFKEIFVGLNDFKALFTVSVCEYAGYFLLGVIAVCAGKNVNSIIYAFSSSLMITIIVGFRIIFHKYCFANVLVEKKAVLSGCKKIFNYAKYIAVSGIGAVLLTEVDTFMLGYYREGYDIAVYSIAKQLTSKAIHVNLALSAGMMTAFANITVENVEEKKKQLKKVMLYNFIVTFGITAAFLIFGKFTIQLLYGKKYLSAAMVLFFLLPYYIISSFSKFLVLFLDYQNKARIRSIAFGGTILLDIMLNAVLIPRFGAIGACIATDVALLLYFIFLVMETGMIFKEYSINGKNGKNNIIRKLHGK